jgi:hypothetical protein
MLWSVPPGCDRFVLDRAPGRGVVFPYDAVKVEFLLRAAS